MKGNVGTFPVTPGDLPLQLTVRLNGGAGQCADVAYEVEPGTLCFDRGDKVICKK